MAKLSWAILSWLMVSLLAETDGITTTSFLKDLSLTRSEKLIFDKFKEKILSTGVLNQEYMKQDVYLIRWLRAKEFNINEAVKLMKEDIKWRKVNKMDTILQEDWTELREMYPYYTDTVARDGSPSNMGDWDGRVMAVAGRMHELRRYQAMFIEDSATQLREMQRQGKNITRGHYIINMDNFNIIQHACVQCIPFYTALVDLYENHYPYFLDRIFIFNVPPTFQVILQAMRELMSPMTREALRVYGQNKSQWRKALLEFIDESQLRPEMGGTFGTK